MYTDKILYGFSDIYISDGSAPIPIKGAISIEINITNEVTHARLQGVPSVPFTTNGTCSGQMEILGLNKSEMIMMLGYKEDSNGGIVVGNPTPPVLHLLFSRECADNSKQYYHVYNVRFYSENLNANTMVEGSLEQDNMILNLEIMYDRDYESYYYTLNSNDNKKVASQWFNELQYPNL